MNKKGLVMILLHIVLALYSFLGIFSKLASNEELMSIGFLLYYGLVLAGLFIYAIIWQQLIKKMPLVTAYANKAVTVIWGIIWGYAFFNEPITMKKMVGAVIIIVGVYLVVSSDHSSSKQME